MESRVKALHTNLQIIFLIVVIVITAHARHHVVDGGPRELATQEGSNGVRVDALDGKCSDLLSVMIIHKLIIII